MEKKMMLVIYTYPDGRLAEIWTLCDKGDMKGAVDYALKNFLAMGAIKVEQKVTTSVYKARGATL